MSAVRTVDEWKEILEPLGAQEMSEIARRVVGDLVHYHEGRSCFDDDMLQLGNAMEAWMRLGMGR